MVDVGVGQEHRVNAGGGHRQGDILKCVDALLHAAVHQILGVAHFQQSAGTGDLVTGADELYLHK